MTRFLVFNLFIAVCSKTFISLNSKSIYSKFWARMVLCLYSLPMVEYLKFAHCLQHSKTRLLPIALNSSMEYLKKMFLHCVIYCVNIIIDNFCFDYRRKMIRKHHKLQKFHKHKLHKFNKFHNVQKFHQFQNRLCLHLMKVKWYWLHDNFLFFSS